jgi:hypothetical protein
MPEFSSGISFAHARRRCFEKKLKEMNPMMKQPMIKWSTLLGASAIALIGVAGCADRNKNGQPDSAATEPEISKAVDKAGDAAKSAGTTVVKGTEKAANAVAETGENAVTTGKIKAAFMANPSIKALAINVSTQSDQKTVMLDGNVTNAAQKGLAGQLAKKNAPADFKIQNNLKVAGGASPMMKKPAAKKAP